MSIDLKKEREKIVSGSANVFYDEEVKITGERTSNNLSVFIHLGYLCHKSWHMRAKKAYLEEDPKDSVTN